MSGERGRRYRDDDDKDETGEKNVNIVGLGSVGTDVADLLRGLDVKTADIIDMELPPEIESEINKVVDDHNRKAVDALIAESEQKLCKAEALEKVSQFEELIAFVRWLFPKPVIDEFLAEMLELSILGHLTGRSWKWLYLGYLVRVSIIWFWNKYVKKRKGGD